MGQIERETINEKRLTRNDQRETALACRGRLFFRLQQLPDDVLQDSAVTVILRLLRRIDAHQRVELHRAILALGFHFEMLARFEVVDQTL